MSGAERARYELGARVAARREQRKELLSAADRLRELARDLERRGEQLRRTTATHGEDVTTGALELRSAAARLREILAEPVFPGARVAAPRGGS